MQSNDTIEGHNKMASRDASSLKSKRELEAEAKLPEIGSYRLIQEVVNEIQVANRRQEDLEERQDINSKRAYLKGTNLTSSITKSEEPGK